MMQLTMKFRILFPAIGMLALTLSGYAQTGSQKIAEGRVNAIMQPFSILMQLEPVVLNAAPELNLPSKKEFYSFDLSTTRQQFPGLIRWQTTWTQKGKNNPVAKGKEAVNLEQLVPLLVAALQQQRKELMEIHKKLDKMQEQSNRDHKTK
ncbi:hypothetical protein [Mucilaginibacter phyllosphaerae]